MNPTMHPFIDDESTFSYPKLYSESCPGPRSDIKRYSDLMFPGKPPPGNLTHYDGAWIIDPTRGGARYFRRYPKVATANTIPSNISNDPTH